MPSAKFGRPCTGLQRSLLSKRIRLDYGAQVLSYYDAEFIKTKLKDAGGTFWFGARLWIVERSQAEGALNEIAAYFDR